MTSKQSSRASTAAILLFVCAAVIAVGMLTKSWATASQGSKDAYVGLLGSQSCDLGTCTATEAPTLIRGLGYIGFVGALAAIGGCIAIGAMVLSKHTAKIPIVAMQAILAGGGGLGLIFLIRALTQGADNTLAPGWSALFGLGGVVGAILIFQTMVVPDIGPVARKAIDGRKVGALAVLLSISGLVTALFLWMVGPASAREVQAACNGMGPTWSNAAYKQLPAPAPDFELKDVKGNTVKLSDLRGKVVLVNFWASWCAVCKSEKKSLARLTDDLAGDDFAVLSLASDTDLALVDESLRTSLGSAEHKSTKPFGGAPFQVLLDPPSESTIGDIGHSWGVEKVPDSFLIDRKGQIRMYLVNKRNWSSGVVKTCVQSLIDE
jgi:peroxiredoxin